MSDVHSSAAYRRGRRRLSTALALAAGLSLGLPLAGLAQAQLHSGQKFDDWTVQCGNPQAKKPGESAQQKSGDPASGEKSANTETQGKIASPVTGKEKCIIFQNLVLKKTHQLLLHVAVGHLPDDKPALIMTLPLGISLPEGVGVKVDNGKQIEVPVQRCQRNGCIAGLLLKDKLLAAMKAGREADVTFYDARRRPITVPVSLKGFTAGYSSLE